MNALLRTISLPLGLALVSAGDPVNEDFEAGSNVGLWSFNVTTPDVLESSGGNPGGWLHNPFVSSFAPILTSGAGRTCFVGDYRARGVTGVSIDAQTLSATFGAVGFEFSLLLRDTKGTPLPDDDDYAYFVGPEVPQPGAGWKHFVFAIPSADTSAVPAGWSGGWAGDAVNFRPGVDWNDVITNVDRVEFWWLNPSFFAIFQSWDVGADNLVLEIPSASATRNGGGSNPAGYVETAPALFGGTWTTTVDIATPGAFASLVAIATAGPTSVPLAGTLHGELLILPPLVAIDVAVGTHAIAIPADCALAGATLYTQAATFLPGDIALNNAIDTTIGTF